MARWIIRSAGLVGLAAAAVVCLFVLKPTSSTPVAPGATVLGATHDYDKFEAQVAAALDDWQSNEDGATSSPQQGVVAGWAAKDLLTTIARIQNDAVLLESFNVENTLAQRKAKRDDREPALLVIGIIAIAWIGLTSWPDRQRIAATSAEDRPAEIVTA